MRLKDNQRLGTVTRDYLRDQRLGTIILDLEGAAVGFGFRVIREKVEHGV